MILANFTPEPIHWMHEGKEGWLKTGDIAEFADNRARHILNKFDRLGLLQLNFGDDPEKKRVQAMETWTNFWKRQITIFNQDNERRKNTNREYVDPSDQLKDHAQRLGLELVGPWSIKSTDNAQMIAVQAENETLKSQVAMLAKQVGALAEAMKSRDIPFELRTPEEKIELSKGGVESQPEVKLPETKLEDATLADSKPAFPDYAKLVNEFSKLSKERFGEWVMTNLERIQSPEFPPAVKTMVTEKWERLIKADFPVPV